METPTERAKRRLLSNRWTYPILRALHDGRPRRLTDIVEVLGTLRRGTVWPNTVSTTLSRMGTFHLVTSTEGPDQVITYTITPLGRSLVAALEPLEGWYDAHWSEPGPTSGTEDAAQ